MFFVSITVCLTTIEYYPQKCWSEYRWKRPLQAQSVLQSQTSHECRLLSIWPCLGSRQLLSLRDAMTLLEWRGWEFENRCDTCGIFSTGSHFAPGPVASDAPADITPTSINNSTLPCPIPVINMPGGHWRGVAKTGGRGLGDSDMKILCGITDLSKILKWGLEV